MALLLTFTQYFAKYIPVVFAASTSDSFTGAAATLLENHTSDGGHTWARNSAFSSRYAEITDANRIRTNSNAPAIYNSSWTPTTLDYDVSVDVYTATTPDSNFQMGVGGRAGTTSFTGYYALVMGANGQIALYRGGSGTSLGTYNLPTIAAGETHNLKLRMRGNSIKVLWDNSVVIDATATGGNIITDVGTAALYLQGVGTNTTGNQLDNFAAADKSTTPIAGVLSEVSHTSTNAVLSWTDSVDGTGAVTAQLQKSLAGQNSWSNVTGATSSPGTATSLSSSTAYDFRVAYTDTTPSTSYSNTVTITTNEASSTYTVQTSDLWDNGYDNVAAPRQSAFSRLVFTTTASSITVTGTTTIYDNFPTYAHLGVRVNGVNQTALAFTANGTRDFTVSLGSLGVSKTVVLTAGLQSKPGSNVLGTFIDSVSYPTSTSFTISTPTVSNRLLIYGDSISVGANATNPEYAGYAPLLRNTYGFNMMAEAWGYRSLHEDANTSLLRSSLVSRLAGYTPTTIWIAIGTNDYGINKWSASNFGTAYNSFIEDLHTSLPTAKIFCQTPIVRSSDGANGYSNTLAEYRSQITTACSNRNYAVVVDGTTLVSLSDLDDGLHPTTAGHAIYATAVANILETTAPTITNITANPSNTSVALTWTTNESSSTQVEYGLSTTYGTTTTETDYVSRVTSHSVTISGLAACTTYHYRVKSKDGALNQAVSSDQTFTTSGCAASSSVSSVATSSITTASGGSLSLLAGDSTGLNLTVPSGFSAGNANFQAHKLDKTTLLATSGTPTGYSAAGSYLYELSALSNNSTKISSFNAGLTVTMTYADSDISGLNEASLTIYRWDGASWNSLTGCSVNTSLNQVTCTTTSFSVFGLFAQASSGSSSNSSNTSGTSDSSCHDQPTSTKLPWLYGAIARSANSIELYFTPADNPVTKYILEYGTKSGEYRFGLQDMGVNSREQMSYLIKSLKANTTYYFRIRAQNGCAVGDWSNEISVRTKNIVTLNDLDIVESNISETPSQKPVEQQSTDVKDEVTSSDPKQSDEYSLKVKVVDKNNQPISGAKVTVHSKVQEAITNNLGVAQFKNVEKGEHRVLIAYKNYEGEQSLNLTGDNKEVSLNITVHEKPFSLSPLAIIIISILLLVIVVLIIFIKTRKDSKP